MAFKVTKKIFKATDTISKKIIIPVDINIQKQINGIQNQIDNIQNQVGEADDQLDGGLDSSNFVEYRNTYVFNNYGILDATHDLIIDFELIDEMTKLVECKVSFKVRNFNIGVKDI